MLSGQKGLAVTLKLGLSREEPPYLEKNEERTLKLKACPVPKALRAEPPPRRCHNHFEGGGFLCTKRGLCESLVAHFLHFGRDPFGAVPLTFLVHGSSDPQFAMFEEAYRYFSDEAKQRIWIVKPAEWANRGCGIRIFRTIEEVRARVDAKERAWAIQKYIEKPLLVHGRKFDIRAYCLLLQDPATMAFKAFCYRDAYLRTTSAQYTTKTFDRMVHLNNDAVQKKGDDYGKFEPANKMSLEEFQKYLDEHHVRSVSVREDLMVQVQGLMTDAMRATVAKMNPRQIVNCFEVFGFDFMVDVDFRTWLIECNANPCLDLCSAYLSHLIPSMLDSALQLTVDQIFADIGAGGKDGAGSKWDLLLDTAQEAPGAVSSAWVEELPAGADGSLACFLLLAAV
ncbi:TTL [Symbiodinium natans]|uniref:TTL protein n=1 Tax=Symbiodinium natans TaxID=878477 RepID=A0A812IP49_9DINO|nr:TTL [Symbiodinium natans]